MTFRWRWLIGSLLAVIGLLWWNGGERQRSTRSTSTDEDIVRVLLPLDGNNFVISSPSSSLMMSTEDSNQPTVFATGSVDVNIKDKQATILGQAQRSSLQFHSSSGLVSINDREYQGTLFLSIKNNRGTWVLHTPLESYVARVVEGEMSSHWPLEALKAQAVIARSFAIFHVRRHESRDYDLLGDSRAQAFSSSWPSSSSELATQATEGWILTQNNKILLTYYHSTCGGTTKAFQQESMTFDSVECEYCQGSPHYAWEQNVPIQVLRTLLSKGLEPTQRLKKVTCLREPSGHVTDVIFSPYHGSSIQINGNTFRKHLNKTYQKEVIKSLNFDLKLDHRQHLIISGHGWGYHGIGLCQYGSKKMAELNFSHEDILKHYYSRAELKSLKP